MRIPSPMRIATLALLAGGLACAKNSANEEVGAARDTTGLDTTAFDTTVRDTMARDTAGVPDSLKPNQSKSGVTDTRTGESTIPEVTKTRPDQGEPVTSKGDTINQAVDSSTSNPAADSLPPRQTVVDSSMSPESADSSAADTSTADTSATAR